MPDLAGFQIAPLWSGRAGALPVPIGVEFPACWMLHDPIPPRGRRWRDRFVPLSGAARPLSVVRDLRCSVHAGAGIWLSPSRICVVKINLTMSFVEMRRAGSVRSLQVAGLLQGPAVVNSRLNTGGGKRSGHCTGRGGDTRSVNSALTRTVRAKDRRDQGGP